ncbi:MAG TPA: extracellular solute-binding protein [Firmicutes bacterium]|nr:extracellular solute-binding protein [Bacillota bacterium]
MPKKRGLYAVIFLLALLLVLQTSVVYGAGKVQLNFWSLRTEDVPAYQKFIKAFEAKNPGITVKFTAYKNTEYRNILKTAILGGSGPDLFWSSEFTMLQEYADNGYLMPLDGKVPAIKTNFRPGDLEGVKGSDGKIYGIPHGSYVYGVYYNKNAFKKFGLAEPQSWPDLIKVAQAIKGAGAVPFAQGTKDSWTLQECMFEGAFGPTFLRGREWYDAAVKGKTNFLDPRFVKALENLLDLKPFFPAGFEGISYTDTQMLFTQERAAMFIGGSWEIGFFERMNPKLDFDMAIGFPETKGGPYWLATPANCTVVNAKTKHPAEVIKFMNFLASKEFGQMYSSELKTMTPILGVKYTHPIFAKASRRLDEAKGVVPFLYSYPVFNREEPAGDVLFANGLQAMFAGKKTPKQVAEDIQNGIAKWYKPFKH